MIDIAGQKFGKLTAIERVKIVNSRHHTQWRCTCDCGQEITVPTHVLTKKDKTSCGCASTHKNLKDIMGKKFHSLTVIERVAIKCGKHYRSVWKCLCDCGKEITAKTSELTSGGRKSCGCTQFRPTTDLVGKKFGKLTVVEKITKPNNTHNTQWKCICDCGQETIATTGKLNYGVKQSCGCLVGHNLKPKFGKDHHCWRGYEEILGAIWYRIIHSAKKRNHEVGITIKEAWDLFVKQDRKCAISGVELHFAKNSKELLLGLNTASLDRIDSNRGYITSNIQWVHVNVNYMKQEFGQSKLLEWCKTITRHQQEIEQKASPITSQETP